MSGRERFGNFFLDIRARAVYLANGITEGPTMLISSKTAGRRAPSPFGLSGDSRCVRPLLRAKPRTLGCGPPAAELSPGAYRARGRAHSRPRPNWRS